MTSEREWRCTQCGKLLGIVSNGRIHIRFAKSHEYVVTHPVCCTCRRCGSLNEYQGKTRATTEGR